MFLIQTRPFWPLAEAILGLIIANMSASGKLSLDT